MPGYSTRIQSIADLSSRERQQIVALYLQYYCATDEAQVIHDLERKCEILLLEHEHSLVGFTSLKLFTCQWQNHSIQVVFSGDTVVAREHWGQQALAFSWIRRMSEIKQKRPDLPLYWFIIVKGHRTFKYLPTFGKSFYPHWSVDRSDLKPLADHLATDMFGEHYNPATGVVEYDYSRGHLKPNIAEPSEQELSKPAVRFFLEKNPNYRMGHELVCLCELEQENMKPFTRRLAARTPCHELVQPA